MGSTVLFSPYISTLWEIAPISAGFDMESRTQNEFLKHFFKCTFIIYSHKLTNILNIHLTPAIIMKHNINSHIIQPHFFRVPLQFLVHNNINVTCNRHGNNLKTLICKCKFVHQIKKWTILHKINAIIT